MGNLSSLIKKSIMGTEDCKFFKCCRSCTKKCQISHSNTTLNLNGLSFYKVMLGNFSSSLEIPSECARRIQKQTCKDTILEGPSGHLWKTNLCYTSGQATFEDGWANFVSDHSMQAGDILVFRQVNNTHFSVQIFGPHACEKQSTSTIDNNRSCLLKEGTLSPICNQKCRILQNPVILCAEQTVIWDAEEKINTQNLLANKHEHDHLASKVLQEESSFCSAVVGQRVKYSQSTCIQKGKQKKSELKSEIKNQLWGQHYSSHTGCPMQFEDLKGPISIKAKRPNFSLVIRKSAVSQGYWLNFPLDFAKRWLPQRRIDVLLMGQTGEWWVTFVGSGRNKGLSRGWRDFATDNKLEEGDTCVITLENMESYTFKVDILRLGKPEKPNRKKKDVERVNAWIRIVKNLTRKSFVNRMKKMT